MTVFISDLFTKVFWCYAALLVFLYLHNRVQPYYTERLNNLETYSIVACCTSLLAGLLFIQCKITFFLFNKFLVPNLEVVHYFVLVFAVALNLGFIGKA